MPGVIFLLLPLSVVIVAALLAIAFLDVVLREPELSISGLSSSVTSLNPKLGTISREPVRLTEAMRVRCRNCIPQVTLTEAAAIAIELRQQGEEKVLDAVRRSKQSGYGCPMLTETGLCVCQITRPNACLEHCNVGRDMPRSTCGLDDARPLNEVIVELLDVAR